MIGCLLTSATTIGIRIAIITVIHSTTAIITRIAIRIATPITTTLTTTPTIGSIGLTMSIMKVDIMKVGKWEDIEKTEDIGETCLWMEYREPYGQEFNLSTAYI